MDFFVVGIFLFIVDGDGDLLWLFGLGIFDGIIDVIWCDFYGRHYVVFFCYVVKCEFDF